FTPTSTHLSISLSLVDLHTLFSSLSQIEKKEDTGLLQTPSSSSSHLTWR
ncbi:hypothetical protein CSUI_008788, partial [Cystoisospora suis]